MPTLVRCPRCSTVATVPDGWLPVCAACGFAGAPTPIPAASPPAAPNPPVPAGRVRPGGLTAVAVAYFLLAGLTLIRFLVAAQDPLPGRASADASSAMATLLVLVGLAVAGFDVLLGVALLRGRAWARGTAHVLSWIGVAACVMMALYLLGVSLLDDVLLLALALWYYIATGLLGSPEVRAYCASQPTQVVVAGQGTA